MTGPGEATGPPFSGLPRDAHLLQPIVARARRDPDLVVAAYREGDAFVEVTASALLGRVRALAKGLIASGVMPGERVVLMSHTRLEWLLLDYAILAAGAVTVPVYETSAAEQLHWILADSGAALAIVETRAMRALLDDIGDEQATVREAIVIDAGELDQLIARGRHIADQVLDARIGSLTIEHIATIIYTSGTTGRPKGCVLTHGNLRANVVQTLDAVRDMLGSQERSLLFLPLAHAFAKLIALVGSEHGVKGVFASDLASLAEELSMAEPTMIVAVPRVFERVFNTAERRSRSEGKGRIFARAAEVATRFARQRAAGGPSLLTRLEHALFERLVYRRIRAAFGGSLRFAFSGAGPLGERLTYFFDGIGVRIFEGYGLTETSPALTVNRTHAWRPGTVGQPLAGTSLRIDEGGEILAKGPQVFSGYWRDDEATNQVFTDDGWLRTGDIGVLEGGFLRITGRKKELIVTAGGKNVAPAPLEDRLRAHPLISQAVVVGDDRPFIAALITIDHDAFAAWRAERDEPDLTVAEVVDRPDLRAVIQEAVDAANAAVSRAESVRAFAILPTDLAIDRGEVTPTMKVRRATVLARYADVIDRLYDPRPG
ncbi:MAG: AMP-dependent synthetase/ligase, partial [Acidimicrobiales bacterium]